jgi:hypothetical protein
VSSPLDPFRPNRTEALAIQALEAGTASESQQKIALRVIVQNVARTHDLDWHPGDQHISSFAAGRRSVGLALLRIINTPAPPAPE